MKKRTLTAWLLVLAMLLSLLPLEVSAAEAATTSLSAAETTAEDTTATEAEDEAEDNAANEDVTITIDIEDGEEIEGETITVIPDGDYADNDEMLEGYLNSILYNEVTVSTQAVYGNYGTTYFTGANLATYNALKSDIEDIAAGITSSTALSYTGSDFGWTWTWDELGLTYGTSSSSEIKSAVSEAFYSEVLYIDLMHVLMADCPYDFYWFDKTTGMSVGYSYSYNSSTIRLRKLTFTFYVAEEFQAGDNTTVDSSAVTTAEAAAENAQEIVDKYVDYNDYNKLVAYRDEICALTRYNWDAISTDTSYGNPWQLIWVFDGDEDTTVVCEGYSKAFQYLCDLSDFTDVTCYTVVGALDLGSHMWNLIKYNGVSFMCDITNSDTGTAGEYGGLFMVCADDAYLSTVEYDLECVSYTFEAGGGYFSYSYNSTTLGLYSEDILTLGKLKDAGTTVTGVSVNPTSVAVDINGTQKLSVTLSPVNPFNSNVTFTSSDSSIATVSSDGTITGVSYGKCTITVTTEDGGWTTTCSVEVKHIHTMQHYPAKAATCISTGNIEYWFCTGCGKYFADEDGNTEISADDIILPIDSSNHAGGTYTKNAVAATCEGTGYSGDIYCSDCGALIQNGKTTAATGHTSGTAVKENVVAATCTATGSYDSVVYCTVCGKELSRTTVTVAKTAHTAGTAVTENYVAATCTSTGSYDTVTYCKNCGAEMSRMTTTIAATGHSYTSSVTKAATCTTAGTRTYTCKNCGDSYTESIAATGHTWDDGVVTTAATHSTTGVKAYTCTVCGATKTETIAKVTFLFDDVKDSSVYYYDAVYWAYDNGITTGTSATLFSPNADCTRAQFVTFLYRLAGEPAPTTTSCKFTDVSSSGYYYKAVLWASENGVTEGTTSTTFSPNAKITRAQAVTMIYRYAGSPSVSTTNPFTDTSSSAYYYNAMLWAVKNGITSGTSKTTFSPNTTCSRAMMVTFLYRYANA